MANSILNNFTSSLVGIDTDDIIATLSDSGRNIEYTATKDCWATVYCYGRTMHLAIDGKPVFAVTSSATSADGGETCKITAPIKKGQVVTAYQVGNHSDAGIGQVIIYGIKRY